MPSTELCLAWCQPVKVDQLGAHLEAYVRLLPVLNTLRLCNRFGQGPKAAVARLPVELIEQIEGHIIDDERKEQRKEWCRGLRCWEGRCEPEEHISLENWTGKLGESLINLAEGGRVDDSELTEEQDGELNELLWEDENHMWELYSSSYRPPPDEHGRWRAVHDECKLDWELKAAGSTPGFFAKHRKFIKKHFGLGVWIAHVQLDGVKSDQWEGNVSTSTQAYLVLPGASVVTREMDLIQPEDDGLQPSADSLPTESSFALPIRFGTGLTKSEGERFERAVKILGLESREEYDDDEELFARERDADGDDEVEDDVPSVSKVVQRVALPRLRLLGIDRYEGTGY